jgi:phosphate transport system substrate-binding protein
MRLAAVLCAVLLLFSCSKKETDRQESNETSGVHRPFDFREFRSLPAEMFKTGHIYDDVTDTTRYPYIYEYISVAVSSWEGEYFATNLIDYDWNSWSPKGNGIGESFTVIMGGISTVAGFAIKNGHENPDFYRQYNRVKTLKIYNDEEYLETITIKDSVYLESYTLQKPVNCERIRFVIDDIYPGTTHNNTNITIVMLFNRIVSDDELYKLFNVFTIREYMINSEEGNPKLAASVSDADRILLLDYLPFDIAWWKTKIARINGQSTLRFNDNLPRLDGATAMYPLYSAFVHAVYPERTLNPYFKEGTQYVDFDKLFSSLLRWGYFPNIDLLNKVIPGADQEVIIREIVTDENINDFINEYVGIVQCNTTSTAYQRLIDGETDIIFCYEPSQAEINAAAAKGKRFNMTPVAKDAFVFIVNERNPLNNITTQQIRDIYSGRVTNWKSITGIDMLIVAYQREENSGSQSTLQSIMRTDTLMRPILGGEYVHQSMGGMVRSIVSDYYNFNSAIGYTFLFYLNNMAGSAGTKVLSIDGVTPNSQTISNGAYPFTQTVYAVTTGNESENTRRFIEWILSAQGQELVRRTGYTPVR